MATDWLETEIVCPFYRSSNRQRREIACEALTDAQIQIMRFKNAEIADEQIVVYCSDVHRMKRCEQYRALHNIKYGGD